MEKRKSIELNKRIDLNSSNTNSNACLQKNSQVNTSLRVSQRRSLAVAAAQKPKQDMKAKNLQTQGSVNFTTAEFPDDGEVAIGVDGSLRKHKKSLPSE